MEFAVRGSKQRESSAPPPVRSTSTFPDPIPGIIPFGTVTLFAGAPASGKTTMLADWCQRWRSGRSICGHATNPPTAFWYISADRPWLEYQPMFEAAGFPDIPHYAIVEDPTISLADLRNPREAHNVFARVLDKLDVQPGAHVFVDPISPLFITGDPNRQRDVAASMIGFSRRCFERQINLTCTVHFAKQKADPKQRYHRPQDRIAGSTSFAGFSCTQVYLCDPEPPKQPYHLMGWNPRHHAPEEFQFVRDASSNLFIPYQVEAITESASTLECVLRCFPTPPENISLEALVIAVKIAHGLSRPTVKRALQSLIEHRRVLRMGRGSYRRVQPMAVPSAKAQA